MATTNTQRAPLKSGAVMQQLGYKDRKSFWEAVWREKIPCTRLSSRNIIFFPAQLEDWIAKRSTGRVT
jgi:hypothetical protein